MVRGAAVTEAERIIETKREALVAIKQEIARLRVLYDRALDALFIANRTRMTIESELLAASLQTSRDIKAASTKAR
jgi:hypothetical protein